MTAINFHNLVEGSLRHPCHAYPHRQNYYNCFENSIVIESIEQFLNLNSGHYIYPSQNTVSYRLKIHVPSYNFYSLEIETRNFNVTGGFISCNWCSGQWERLRVDEYFTRRVGDAIWYKLITERETFTNGTYTLDISGTQLTSQSGSFLKLHLAKELGSEHPSIRPGFITERPGPSDWICKCQSISRTPTPSTLCKSEINRYPVIMGYPDPLEEVTTTVRYDYCVKFCKKKYITIEQSDC